MTWNEMYERLIGIAGDDVAKSGWYFDTDWELITDHVKINIYDGAYFCRECGLAVHRLLLVSGVKDVDGDPPMIRQECSESDGMQCCVICGALLDYWLTEYGCEQEAEHFTHYPPVIPIGRRVAYQLAQVAEAYRNESGIVYFKTLLEGWLKQHDLKMMKTEEFLKHHGVQLSEYTGITDRVQEFSTGKALEE